MDQTLSHDPRAADHRVHRLALFAAVAAVAMQCIGPIFVRKSGFPGIVFAFHRSWIGAGIYAIVSVVARTPPTWRALRLSAAGGFWFACNVGTFFIAVQNTTIANATVIGAIQPIALLLVSSRLFGERLRHSDLAYAVLAIVGVALVVFARHPTGSSGRLGDLCALLSMLAYAAYYIASKKARVQLGTLEYQTSLTIVAAVTLGCVVAVSGQQLGAPRPSSWAWAVAMVALPGTGHLLTNFAHAHVRLGVMGVLTLFSPVGSAFLAWLLLDESIAGWQIVGMVIVVSSIGAIVVSTARGRPVPSTSATAAVENVP